MPSVAAELVHFPSGGALCAADLYMPGNGQGIRRPALVLGNGFAGTKDMMSETGRFFAEAGYVSLVIDYRGWGESEGMPRCAVFPLWQVEDFRNGISYLETRPEVQSDRIGVWGTSMGGGVAMWVGGVDPRARVVISQAPVVDGRRWVRAIRTTEQWEELLARLARDRSLRFRGSESERIPILGHGASDDFCGMPGDLLLVEAISANRLGHPDDMPLESLEKIIEFSPISVVTRIGPRPLLVVTTRGYDMIHPVEHILEAFNLAVEPKRFVGLDYDQMGLYGGPGLEESLATTLSFLDEFLPVGSTRGGDIPRTISGKS
jgi:uncharacterized protein